MIGASLIYEASRVRPITSVTVLGDSFSLSLMNLIWSGFYGVQFSLSHRIMENIRYERLSKVMSDRAKVYPYSERNCSNYTLSQNDY